MTTREWWAVTFRAPAEMVVWVQADNAADAKRAAEEGEYDEATPIEFIKKSYALKARRDPDFDPVRGSE